MTDVPIPLSPAPAPGAIAASFEAMLHNVDSEGVSDVHLVGGGVLWTVKFGKVVKWDTPISDAQILALADHFGAWTGGADALLTNANGSLACMAVVGVPGAQYRLRMAFRRQITGLAMTARFVPETPPRLSDAIFHLNPVPARLVDIALTAPAGLVLVCGPTSSGKSTALAAILAEVNHSQSKHIYTVEDPIEFVHDSRMSLVSQREVGTHTDSFAHALNDSLRSNPDIILVGELRGRETVRVAIEAANKGHLVFATSHAGSAEEAVSSLVSQFPGDEQSQVSTALSQALKAVVVQRLVPTRDDKLIPAREFLLNTIAIASKIQHKTVQGLTQSLRQTDGMWTIEDDLTRLWADGMIDETAASNFCNDRDAMKTKLDYAKSVKGSGGR